MTKKTAYTWTAALSAALLLTVTLSSSVLAFGDVSGEQAAPILDLKERGVVSGVDQDRFVPQGKTTYAEGVAMLVKGLNLNTDNMKFIKAPEASDYFTNVPNDAWYADSFIKAHLNGVPLPKDVNPAGTLTREAFANLLVHAVETKGNFPLIKMYIAFADESEITPELGGAVQRLVLYKFATVGEDSKFYPKRELTRGEAAVWLHNAIRFLENHQGQPEPAPVPQEEVQVTVEKVNDSVNRVVLSRGQKPTSGYGIEITGIRFEGEGRAVVTYKLSDPAPDSMNATVITEPKAETYISSQYKPAAEPQAQ
ncbi:S-layer domain-containing protein [Paenibacillus mucilaginosus 3016]|uniref:S-layer domain-containing protein n=1 Tax=Paenibacillus mucilaginosus 3016 TaxID=1116391 RepID=H6NIR7_9BACL|nr:protease complex subunit PrcB family protein [Paenibacillus mucilaginosus]AFC33134.1 S-layer domain-containing protein [Paenibacillus mucilaginosus 3016]WFA21567.1 protease complex subunit PrcB family protein [Paenibacillus mucilaginosus]